MVRLTQMLATGIYLETNYKQSDEWFYMYRVSYYFYLRISTKQQQQKKVPLNLSFLSLRVLVCFWKK